MANKSQMRKNTLLGYLFIGPWLICFLAFTALPFAASFFLSFTEYNMLSSPKFIGFSNYIRLFTQDNLFMTSLGVTFKFVFISIPQFLFLYESLDIILLVVLSAIYFTLSHFLNCFLASPSKI